jgi:hypothetical protein
MNLFWIGFCYGAASIIFVWVLLSVMAVCMLSTTKLVEDEEQKGDESLKSHPLFKLNV